MRDCAHTYIHSYDHNVATVHVDSADSLDPRSVKTYSRKNQGVSSETGPKRHRLNIRDVTIRGDLEVQPTGKAHYSRTTPAVLPSWNTSSGDIPASGGAVDVDEVGTSRAGNIRVTCSQGCMAIFLFGTHFLTAGHVSTTTLRLLGTTTRAADLARTEGNAVSKIVVIAQVGDPNVSQVTARLRQYFPDVPQVTKTYPVSGDAVGDCQGDYEFLPNTISGDVSGWYYPPCDQPDTSIGQPLLWQRDFARIQPPGDLEKREAKPFDRLIARASSMNSTSVNTGNSETQEPNTSDQGVNSGNDESGIINDNEGAGSSDAGTNSSDDEMDTSDGFDGDHGITNLGPILDMGEWGSVRHNPDGRVYIHDADGTIGVLIFGNCLITGVHAGIDEELPHTQHAIDQAQQEGNVVSKVVIIYPRANAGAETEAESAELLSSLKTLLTNAFHIEPVLHPYNWVGNISYDWRGVWERRRVLQTAAIAINDQNDPTDRTMWEELPDEIIEEDPIV